MNNTVNADANAQNNSEKHVIATVQQSKNALKRNKILVLKSIVGKSR
jgi:hypothetical protein